MRSVRFVGGLVACLVVGTACGDEKSLEIDVGSCSSQVPQGQACNSLVDVAPRIMPACATGDMPIGTGGSIVDGTYTLTAETYYNTATCTSVPVGGTIVVSGNCIQWAAAIFSSAFSTSISVQGNSITSALTCVSGRYDRATISLDAPTSTFTATPTTLTFFRRNSAVNNPNPDRVEVFTRR